MGFEYSNDAVVCIAVMNVGQEKLVVYLPKIFHDTLVLFNGFIVQDLDTNKLITFFSRVMISF